MECAFLYIIDLCGVSYFSATLFASTSIPKYSTLLSKSQKLRKLVMVLNLLTISIAFIDCELVDFSLGYLL
jgi:hypothetical protein